MMSVDNTNIFLSISLLYTLISFNIPSHFSMGFISTKSKHYHLSNNNHVTHLIHAAVSRQIPFPTIKLLQFYPPQLSLFNTTHCRHEVAVIFCHDSSRWIVDFDIVLFRTDGRATMSVQCSPMCLTSVRLHVDELIRRSSCGKREGLLIGIDMKHSIKRCRI